MLTITRSSLMEAWDRAAADLEFARWERDDEYAELHGAQYGVGSADEHREAVRFDAECAGIVGEPEPVLYVTPDGEMIPF